MKQRESQSPEPRPTGGSVDLPAGPHRWRPVGLEQPPAHRAEWPCQRRDERVMASLQVLTTFIDPIRDPVTSEACFHVGNDDAVFSLSRRGAGFRCARPPEVGTRVLLQIRPDGERRPIEVVGRTRWTRVEYVQGEYGARAIAAVGVEFVGGQTPTFDRYEKWLAELSSSVATQPATG